MFRPFRLSYLFFSLLSTFVHTFQRFYSYFTLVLSYIFIISAVCTTVFLISLLCCGIFNNIISHSFGQRPQSSHQRFICLFGYFSFVCQPQCGIKYMLLILLPFLLSLLLLLLIIIANIFFAYTSSCWYVYILLWLSFWCGHQ